MKQDSFVLMLDKFQRNLEEIYNSASANDTTTLEDSKGLLSVAYKELGTASEEMQIAIEELVIKSEELAITRQHLETERQHYKDLFEFLPDAYLITNTQGHILQANQACATLLNVEPRFLKNKPLDIFLSQQERQIFAAKLGQLNRVGNLQNWTVCLLPRHGESIQASVTVAPSYNSEKKLVTLHWSIREIGKNQEIQSHSHKNGYLSEKQSKYIYQQGEIIPLHPDSLWLVSQGWVKLSTLAENGEEIMIGLVGELMPFGSSITSLATYQATALSQQVQLSCIPLTDVLNSPEAIKIIFPQLIERLRYSESLLAISGVRQIHERVNQLLYWLKDNFGQKIAHGYRLRVRLTHQELASACGTTRVTITRLLGKLKKQGKITFDSKHHIIFLD